MEPRTFIGYQNRHQNKPGTNTLGEQINKQGKQTVEIMFLTSTRVMTCFPDKNHGSPPPPYWKTEPDCTVIYNLTITHILARTHSHAQAPKPTPPTCAADIIKAIPILKHVLGVFGLVGASSHCIATTLLESSVILYVGGIAVRPSMLYKYNQIPSFLFYPSFY